MNCHCNQCECERQEPPKEEQHTLTFRRHEITLIKDAPDRNWYIRVRTPSGLMCYDGWWYESIGKTWREALEEAKRGACLPHFKEQPMTDKPTPTDAELDTLLPMVQLNGEKPAQMVWLTRKDARAFSRAVLAKWGQPAQAAEPFCWHWENTFNGGTGAVKKNPETLGINMAHPDYKWTALYTAPQPVAREPLSAAQKQHIHNETGAGHALICLVESYLLDAHGIKGGQHDKN